MQDATALVLQAIVDEDERVHKKATRNGIRWSRFRFTLNNPTELEEKNIRLTCISRKISWLVYGHETAPTTGTKHLQGACVIGRQVAERTIHKTWPGFARAALLPMNATCEKNKEYCTKEDKTGYFEHGQMQEQGKRNDLISVVRTLRTHNSLSDLILDDESAAVYIKYPKGIEKYSKLLRTNDVRERPTVIWLHGTTGTGKSFTAYHSSRCLFGPEQYWPSLGDGFKWFDGYRGQRAVELAELRGDNIEYAFLLRLLDIYPLEVPIKGDYAPWQPELIWITSPFDPLNCGFRFVDSTNQLLRRCTLIAETPTDLPRVHELLRNQYPDYNVPDVLSIHLPCIAQNGGKRSEIAQTSPGTGGRASEDATGDLRSIGVSESTVIPNTQVDQSDEEDSFQQRFEEWAEEEGRRGTQECPIDISYSSSSSDEDSHDEPSYLFG